MKKGDGTWEETRAEAVECGGVTGRRLTGATGVSKS